MKPSWDKLMDEFKDSKTALVADVDCTVEEELCSQNGVEGYPTIKYGTPGELQDYQGGREYDDMLEFAKNNLGPTCGPKNLDLCSDEQKKEIEDAQKLSDEELKAKISEKESAIEATEKKFSEDVEALQKKYEEMMKAKDAKVGELKKSGLSTLKSICNDRPNCKPPPPPPPPPGQDEEAPEGEGEGEEPPEGEGEGEGEGEEPPEGDEPPAEEGKKEEL